MLWYEGEVNCHCKIAPSGRIVSLPSGLRPRFLSGLTEEQRSIALSAATHHCFRARALAIRQGDTPGRFFMLTSGRAAHFVLTRDGTKVPLYWLVPGQIFGGSALLPERTCYFANTEVQTPGCAICWSREDIRRLLGKFPVLMDNALSIAVTEQLAWQLSVRVSLAADDAPMRIARLLIGLACGIGRPAREGIEIAVGNEELAAAANVTPYTFSRIVTQWKRAGVLTKRRGAIHLLRPEVLSAGA